MAPLPAVHRINIRPVQYEDTASAPTQKGGLQRGASLL